MLSQHEAILASYYWPTIQKSRLIPRSSLKEWSTDVFIINSYLENVDFNALFPWWLARVTWSFDQASQNQDNRRGKQVWWQVQTLERLTLNPTFIMSIRYTHLFGLTTLLNLAVFISILSSYTFWWKELHHPQILKVSRSQQAAKKHLQCGKVDYKQHTFPCYKTVSSSCHSRSIYFYHFKY